MEMIPYRAEKVFENVGRISQNSEFDKIYEKVKKNQERREENDEQRRKVLEQAENTGEQGRTVLEWTEKTDEQSEKVAEPSEVVDERVQDDNEDFEEESIEIWG